MFPLVYLYLIAEIAFVIYELGPFSLCIDRCKPMERMQWLTRITVCSSSHTVLEEKFASHRFFFS